MSSIEGEEGLGTRLQRYIRAMNLIRHKKPRDEQEIKSRKIWESEMRCLIIGSYGSVKRDDVPITKGSKPGNDTLKITMSYAMIQKQANINLHE